MPWTPRALALRLLLGAEAQGDCALGVRELLASCALFGLAENRVRVALARATAAGLLVTPRRAAYALGPAAQPLADAARQWRQLPAQVREWNGGWLAVHVGAAGRSDRAALRSRERAFGVLGLAELERGLQVRPDNLADGADGLRNRLRALLPTGVAAGTVFALHSLSAAEDRVARGLWNGAALNAGYRYTTARLSAWLDDARTQALEDAAREAFELGHQAIRQLVFDPWLPAPLIDAAARRRCVAAVRRHDDIGQSIWRQYLGAVRTNSPVRTRPALPRKPALEALR